MVPMAFTIRVERKQRKPLPKPTGNRRSIVKVGFPAGKADSDNINKAVWNEFGTRGSGKRFMTPRGGGFGGPIPERPFMRTALRKNKAKYRQAMKSSAAKILRGETTVSIVLTKLGMLGAQDIQDSITSWTSPPNSPTTIRLKGSSHPLIDHGEMRAAVTWELKL